MVNTRSNSTKAKEEKMTSATEELKCYLEKLIEPLVTNNSLEELFNKLKDEIVKKFDEKISEQNVKTEKLESIITIHENTIDQLLVMSSDNEQYSRRSCLRIHGVEVKENEGKNGVMNVLEDSYSSVNCSLMRMILIVLTVLDYLILIKTRARK